MGIKEGDFVSGNFILKLTLAILIIFFYINGTSIALASSEFYDDMNYDEIQSVIDNIMDHKSSLDFGDYVKS